MTKSPSPNHKPLANKCKGSISSLSAVRIPVITMFQRQGSPGQRTSKLTSNYSITHNYRSASSLNLHQTYLSINDTTRCLSSFFRLSFEFNTQLRSLELIPHQPTILHFLFSKDVFAHDTRLVMPDMYQPGFMAS
jgi:hypothetical protein